MMGEGFNPSEWRRRSWAGESTGDRETRAPEGKGEENNNLPWAFPVGVRRDGAQRYEPGWCWWAQHRRKFARTRRTLGAWRHSPGTATPVTREAGLSVAEMPFTRGKSFRQRMASADHVGDDAAWARGGKVRP
jgi:hypothetical protein